MVAASAGFASGQQAFVSFPTEIRRALVSAEDACRRAGGARVTLSVNAVRKVDLTGDGRDDYIIDFHETECVGRAAFFCGTGGCDLLILVALRGGALRKVFDDRVREYEILSGRGASDIRFVLHLILRWTRQSVLRKNTSHHVRTHQIHASRPVRTKVQPSCYARRIAEAPA